jgi:hypothetical protein
MGPEDFRNHICYGGDWDAVEHCHIPNPQMAADICAIHTPQGDANVTYDPPVKIEDHQGIGECGEPAYRITCHRPSGTQVLYDTQRLHAIQVPFGEQDATVALSFCLKQKQPSQNYSHFRVWDSGAPPHGDTAIRVICYGAL